ncbi:hypothetical protein ACFLWS_04060 [Chloroflexota bacterium]
MIVERIFNAREQGIQQLEREKAAVELYKQAILLARNNVVHEKVEYLSEKFIKFDKRGFRQEIHKASEVISILERIEEDEIRHAKTVQGMLETYSFLDRET